MDLFTLFDRIKKGSKVKGYRILKKLLAEGKESHIMSAIDSLYEWVDEGIMPFESKRHAGTQVRKLLKYHNLLAQLCPIPKPPTLLYRGISYVKGFPKSPKTKVTYSTKYPYTAWSGSKGSAESYCREILLIVRSRVLLANSKLFVWPIAPTSELGKLLALARVSIVNKQEWAVKLVKTIDVDSWERCSLASSTSKSGRSNL